MKDHSDAHTTQKAKSLVQKRFGKQSQEYDRHGLLSDQANLNEIVRLAEVSEGDRVLDVATGTGWLAAVLAETAGQLVSSDLTAEMLARARSKVGKRDNTTFALADAENLPFSKGSFNVVTCRVAVHHMTHPVMAFSEMARVCTPKGRIVVMDVISSEDDAQSEYHNQMEQLRDPSHIREYKRSEMEQMLRSVGLDIIQVQLWAYDWSVDEWLQIGGPEPDAEKKVRDMMLDAMDGDKSGTQIRMKDGELVFTYTTAVILARPLGG